MKSIVPALLFCLACVTSSAHASGDQGSTLSNASGLVVGGSAVVVAGSLSAVAGSGMVVVQSVETAGNASVVVLKGASQAVGATLRLSGNVVGGASLVAGHSVEVVAVSTGYVLVSLGQVLAFVPNELGRSLLHHSRVGA